MQVSEFFRPEIELKYTLIIFKQNKTRKDILKVLFFYTLIHCQYDSSDNLKLPQFWFYRDTMSA